MPQVYFIKLNELEKIKELLPQFKAPLGVKVHFGEEGNITFVPANLIKAITDMAANPTLIECSVLYKSPRSTAQGHKQVALNHGFNFAPLDFLDGEEGDDNIVVEIDGRHFKQCYLGKGLAKYNSILAISHFKGHGGSGFGGALKNMGMGLASRRGKLAIHASIKHQVDTERCISCGTCIAQCPEQAISFNQDQKAEINYDLCISCSKCISVCPQSAIRIPWDSTGSQDLQERIAEYTKAVVAGRQCYYINFLINITHTCDCAGKEMEKITEDIGVLASSDPVAIDQASYDLVVKQFKAFKDHSGDYQLQHGEKIILGKREYELINL